MADRKGRLAAKFWGVRGSIPCPGKLTSKYGGNTSCIELLGGSDIIVLDAGTGIRELGLELVKTQKHVRRWKVKVNRMNGARKAAAKRAATRQPTTQ